MKSLILLIVVALLAGCSTLVNPSTPVGMFILSDAKAASDLAKANKDTAGVQCYDFIAADIDANTPGSLSGILYLNEVKRTALVKGAGLATACGGVLPLMVAP
jgi:uncharacterized protein YceK